MLRKLMIVAHRLEAAPLLMWAKQELNGYEDDDSLPSYRGPMAVQVRAQIVGPGGAQGTNYLTSHGIPDGFDGLFKAAFSEPLAGIESLSRSDEGIHIPWDPVAVGFYNKWIDERRVPFIPLWGVYSASKTVSSSVLQSIVDVVRTKALELALDLQSAFPDAGEVGGPTMQDPAVRSTVMHITNNIYGPVNGLAQGHVVRPKVVIRQGDLVGALTAARAFLTDSSIVTLSQVLATDGSDDEKRGKLDQLIAGIKSGAIAIAGGVATDLAAEGVIDLVRQFFGW